MSITRHDIRESEFMIIFEKMFREESISELLDIALDNEAITVNDEVKEACEGLFANIEEIDGIISKFSEKRNLARMPKINLAILRLAVYEINYNSKAPTGVVINEAVGLAKKYALEPDVALVNGILGAYSRSLESENK